MHVTIFDVLTPDEWLDEFLYNAIRFMSIEASDTLKEFYALELGGEA